MSFEAQFAAIDFAAEIAPSLKHSPDKRVDRLDGRGAIHCLSKQPNF
jgi:hypothetical protein